MALILGPSLLTNRLRQTEKVAEPLQLTSLPPKYQAAAEALQSGFHASFGDLLCAHYLYGAITPKIGTTNCPPAGIWDSLMSPSGPPKS